MKQKLLAAVRSAGAIALEVRKSGALNTRDKLDGSPVSDADMRMHHFLVEALTQIVPVPVVSEEGLPDPSARKTWQRFWLVDPLDGTKEFVAGLDEFAVCVALIENRRPVLSAIHGPALNETYLAQAGAGAWQIQGESELRLPLQSSPRPPVALVSRSHRSTQVDEYLSQHSIEHRQPVGSALKFGRIGAGRASIYPRLSPIREWDIVAGDLIITESGGKMLDLEGKPLLYNSDELINPPFIATSHDFAKL